MVREKPLGNRKAVGRGGRDRMVLKDGSKGANKGFFVGALAAVFPYRIIKEVI